MAIVSLRTVLVVVAIAVGHSLALHFLFDLSFERALLNTAFSYNGVSKRSNFTTEDRFPHGSVETRAFMKVMCSLQKERPKDIHAVRKVAEGWRHMMDRPVPDTITETSARGVRSIWVTHPMFGTAGVKKEKTLLYLHGGGYTLLSPDIYAGFLLHVSRVFKTRVLAIDYRLAPEHPLPAAVDDALASYKYLIEDLQVDPKDIVVMGDSAGGGLTLLLLQALLREKLPQPVAALPMSPLADLTGKNVAPLSERLNGGSNDCFIGYADYEHMGKWVLGPEGDRPIPPTSPLVSPLFGEFKGLAPLYLSVTDVEILYPDSVNVAEKARKAGVDVYLEVQKDLLHVYPVCTSVIPEAGESLGRMAFWVEMKRNAAAAAKKTKK